jgi:hypothetical protein
MIEVLNSLKLVDINQLCLHEEHEPMRLTITSEAIKGDGFLRHPVIATKISDGRYLVLDGVHRIGALRLLGSIRVPVQLVEKQNFSMETWEHSVNVGEWTDTILEDDAFLWNQYKTIGHPVIQLVDDHGNRKYLSLEYNKEEFLCIWHKIVSSYTHENSVVRMPQGSCLIPDEGKVLIKYPEVSFDFVERVILEGDVLPAGVTRFKVNGRLLNLQIPLHLLSCETLCEVEWQEHLRRWKESLRLYTEQIYLYES